MHRKVPSNVNEGRKRSSLQFHKKAVSSSTQNPLSAADETDDVVFSRDSQELIRRPSFSDTLQKAEKSHQGWLKKLASHGRRWNPRYFVVHGHYLSYFKIENTNDAKHLMGTLNLWRVDSVTLDQSIIVITLAPEISLNGSIFRHFQKKTMANRILLEAKDSAEASRWITMMKITPFEELPMTPSRKDLLVKEEEESFETSAGIDIQENCRQASRTPETEDVFKVQSMKVLISDDKVYDFFDVAEVLETTRLRIGELQPGKDYAVVQIKAVSHNGSKVKTAESRFEPLDDPSGIIKIPFNDGSEVHVTWERDTEASIDELVRQAMAEDSPSSLIIPFASGIFVMTFFIVYFVLEFRSSISTVTASLMSGSAAALLTTSSPSRTVSSSSLSLGPRYVFTSVGITPTNRRSSVSTAARVTEAARKKATDVTDDQNEDLSILPDEKAKIVELRNRLSDVRSPTFIEKQMREGRLDRILSEWKVDSKDSEAILKAHAVVCKKYLDPDFRLVRFLRARNQSVEKAAKMARASLLWRIGFGPDVFVETFKPPTWIIEYGGSPLFQRSLSEPGFGTENRLANWWQRDKQGSLSMFIRAGGFDWRKVSRKVGDPIELTKVGIWALEVCRVDMDYLHVKTNGAFPSYVTVVIDMEGFSLIQQLPLRELLPIARRFFSVLATSFPELLKRVIIVNSPFLFNGFWQAIRPFIPEEVQDKIHIHGRCNMEKHLKPYFDEEMIPAYLGGKLFGPNGDPFCLDRLCPAGPFKEDSGVDLLKSNKQQ